MEQGGIEPGKVVLGMRAGFCAIDAITHEPISKFHGHRSLVNFQAMYSLNKWLLVGMMLEWSGMGSTERPIPVDLDIRIPCRCFRQSKYARCDFGPVIPYANMSFGVNVNSFGESSAISGTTISPSNTFAWRLGWGADYMPPNCSR